MQIIYTAVALEMNEGLAKRNSVKASDRKTNIK